MLLSKSLLYQSTIHIFSLQNIFSNACKALSGPYILEEFRTPMIEGIHSSSIILARTSIINVFQAAGGAINETIL
jgi:hypothetical protein